MPHMLEVSDISFSYNRRALISQLSFRVEPGECLILAGPNGSGKSTVLSLLAGIRRPDSGEIRVNGRISLVPQDLGLFPDLTVDENLRFFAGLAGKSVPAELPLGVGAYRKKRVSRLSGGMQKRVSILCSLLTEPQVLLLDEPCSGLDLLYRDELAALVSALKQQGIAILYVGHEPAEFSAFYDRLIFMGGEEPAYFTREQLSGTSGDSYKELQELEQHYRELCIGSRRQ